MGHVVTPGVDDEPLNPPDIAIGGMDLLATAYGHLAQGDGVMGDRGIVEAEMVGPVEHLFGVVAGVASGRPQKLRLFGEVKLLKLGSGASESDVARRSVDKVERNKSAEPLPVFWFDDE